MDKSVKILVFLSVYLSVSLFVSGDPQLSNIILKPAENFFNALTGNYFTESTNDGHNERPQSSNYRPSSNYNSNYQVEANYHQQPNYPTVTGSCSTFWSYNIDGNEKWGLLTLPNPSYTKNSLKVTLSLAAQLQTVSFLLVKQCK